LNDSQSIIHHNIITMVPKLLFSYFTKAISHDKLTPFFLAKIKVAKPWHGCFSWISNIPITTCLNHVQILFKVLMTKVNVLMPPLNIQISKLAKTIATNLWTNKNSSSKCGSTWNSIIFVTTNYMKFKFHKERMRRKHNMKALAQFEPTRPIFSHVERGL